MGIDLNGDRETLISVQSFGLNPVRNALDGCEERFPAEHDMPWVGGNTVNTKCVVG